LNKISKVIASVHIEDKTMKAAKKQLTSKANQAQLDANMQYRRFTNIKSKVIEMNKDANQVLHIIEQSIQEDQNESKLV